MPWLALLYLAVTLVVSICPHEVPAEQQILLGHAQDLSALRSWEEADFISPAENAGSFLARFCHSCPGEPLNVIISARSDSRILNDQGFAEYIRTLGFEPYGTIVPRVYPTVLQPDVPCLHRECFNLHLGDRQKANLGDGQGWSPELLEVRQSYRRLPRLGTCIESVIGGNHLRVWKQNGTEADTGAWFLAVSLEDDLRHDHNILPNGYDRGRDQLVNNAHHSKGWKTTVNYLDGFLEPGKKGINHGIDIDGKIALLLVEAALEHQ